jgi:DNA-binding response OmpR family regulator
MPEHRILVVDDEDMIRDSLIEYLDENGYRAMGAVDGRDALSKLSAVECRPCLILLDLMMPVMDGQTFRAQQLLNPDLARIPVIVLSAHQGVAKVAHGLKLADHLAKPFKLDELLRLVHKHCRGGD